MRIPIMSAVIVLLASSVSFADPLTCNLAAYKATAGLTASVSDNTLVVTWDGDRDTELRLRFAIDGGTPTIRELAVRKKAGQWTTLATNVTPEFRIVTGLRRATQQQTEPLEKLGIALTPAVIDKIKWEAFWDAPLYIEGSGELPPTHQSAIPAMKGVANQPGLPRKPEEVQHATATYQASSCEVKTNGARIEISFPGVTAGSFSGRLQYNVFKGTSLIRQVVIAKTDLPSVAFKYDGGLKGLPIAASSRVVWRDLAGRWQDQRFGGPTNRDPATVWSSNRLIAADLPGGSIAAFPPPHSFYGARESNQVLGDNYYRKDSATSFAFGIRQAEKEEDPEFLHNFALTSARPGTWQQMPVFLYVTADAAPAAVDAALTFTRGDTYKPLPGYQIMGSHYHVGMVPRLKESGSLNNRLNDVESLKAIGINIFGVIDGVRGRENGDDYLAAQAEYYEAARLQSDDRFLVMPNKENVGIDIGGHHDLMVSKPVFWLTKRAAGQPLVTQHPKYGKVYNLGSPADLFEMTRLENLIINMPHPRSKGSTGYPEAVKETHFAQPTYEGVGLPLGHGHRRIGDTVVRIPVPGPVRRDDELVRRSRPAAQAHAGHLGVAVRHRRQGETAV